MSDELKIMKARKSYDFNYGDSLAPDMTKIIDDDNLGVDFKRDGTRAIIDIDDDGNITIYGRGTVQKELHSLDRERRIYNTQFPELIPRKVDEGLRGMRFDAEITIQDPSTGKENYNLLETRVSRKDSIGLYASRHPATIEIFDILRNQGEDITGAPLIHRRDILERINLTSLNRASILPIAIDQREKRALMIRALKLDLEGVMIKELDAPYVDGRGKWAKAKRTHTEDVIVLGMSPGQGKFAPYFGMLHCYKMNQDKSFTFVCDVGGGFTFSQMTQIKEIIGEYLPRPDGDNETKDRYKYLSENNKLLVIEIKHYGIVNTGRRHPVFLRIRTDKDADECLTTSTGYGLDEFV